MYRNRFALKKLKPNKVLGFFLLCSFLIFLIFSIFAKFSFAKTYTGTYLCSKNECTLTSMLLVQEIENLNSKQNIYIGEEQVELKIKTFKNVQYYDAIPVQEVVFIVPKFDFFNYQMLSYTFDFPKKNIWQILWENWKGGEDVF